LDYSGDRGGDFGVDFVGRNFDERLVDGNTVTDGF
jgi:hypothetical protein